MGCFGSKEQSPEANVSHAIDLKIKQDAAQERNEFRLLLLGAGESGKSTINKQMRAIEGNPLSEAEKDQFTDVCRTNMVSSLQIILDNMLLLGIDLTSPSLKDTANYIVSLENEHGSVGLLPDGEMNPLVLSAVIELWKDDAVQRTAKERSNEFQLNDSAEYFLDNAQRLGEKGWKPNEMDVLKARVKTTGISETKFSKQGKNFTVVDVGGQRSERRKWLHCFEDVTSLLYVVALNEYNMMLREDETVNRMREALVLYHSIITSAYFRDVSVILFLNKADLLRRKCRSGQSSQLISSWFEEFPKDQDATDWKTVFRFIEKLFLSSHTAPDVKDERIRGKKIYAHMCTATDRETMEKVLGNVNDIILRSNILAAGLIT